MVRNRLIPPLENQSLAHRIVTTFIIVVIVILAIAFLGWITGGWDTAPG
jgi:hypothetical protein